MAKVPLPEVVQVRAQGEDADTIAHLVAAGFFAVWLVDELDQPYELARFRLSMKLIKGEVTKDSAIRVLRAFSRAHPRSKILLALVDEAEALPWDG